MQDNQIIERFGGVIKREELTSLQDSMFDKLIFEASHPFPGYYDEYSTVKKPLYFYLVTTENIDPEHLFKANQKINKEFNHPFESTYGVVNLLNETYPVIRIRKIEKESYVNELISLYEKQGIEFQKKSSREIKADGLIKLYKFFQLEDLGDNIFLDHSEKEFLYFYLPREMNWNLFEKATVNVKYNWNKSHFDAALGFFIINEKVTDVARIYHEKVDKDFIKELLDLYCREIEMWK